jgi:hypothetical protein
MGDHPMAALSFEIDLLRIPESLDAAIERLTDLKALYLEQLDATDADRNALVDAEIVDAHDDWVPPWGAIGSARIPTNRWLEEPHHFDWIGGKPIEDTPDPEGRI